MDTEVHLGKKLIIIQGLKLRGACSTSLPLSHLSKGLIQYYIDCCFVFIFHSAWFLLKQLTSVETSIHYTTFITDHSTAKPPSTWLAHLVECQTSEGI